MRTLRILVTTTPWATLSPLIPLHALIRILLMFMIIRLLLFNLLAIIIDYPPVARLMLHVVTLRLETVILGVWMKGLGNLPVKTTNIVPVTAITVTVN